ncbi:MAG TPA: catalase HPII, partial [Trebonia sp.]|nr:catalase HPII [Trebonia sp.]
IGVLVTDGADADTIAALRSAAAEEGAIVEIVAPTAGGVDASDGSVIPGKQIDGAPSVVFDAVAIVAAAGAAGVLAANPAARDFVSDAYAHCKFIGLTDGAQPLFAAAGLGGEGTADGGFVDLGEHSAADFVARCRQLRFWDRQRAMAAS